MSDTIRKRKRTRTGAVIGRDRFVSTFVIVILALALSGCGKKDAPPAQHANAPAPKPNAPPAPVTAPTSKKSPTPAPAAHLRIEQQALDLLSNGQQAEAEKVIRAELDQHKELKRFASLVAVKDDEAAKMLRERRDRFQDQQRLLFLFAACQRSRFVPEAFRSFAAVVAINRTTPAGMCAEHVLFLDSEEARGDAEATNRAFAELTKLADSHPNDVVIRWTLATECESWNRNEEGLRQCAKILEKWKPAPVLVLYTYANFLDALDRHEQALVERRKAVQLEPCCWTYDGLGRTLAHLRRYDEALTAYTRAVESDPTHAQLWSNWAATWLAVGKYESAIEKCQQAIKLDSKYWRAWLIWGVCLQELGKDEEALEKLRKALLLNPVHDDTLQARINALKKKLGRP